MTTLQFRKKKKKNILAWSLTHRIAHSDHGRWCQEANRYVSGHPSMLATPWAELILLFENTTSVSIWWYVTMLGYLFFFVCASCILFAMFSDSKQVCKSPRISGRTKQWWTKYFQLQWMGLRQKWPKLCHTSPDATHGKMGIFTNMNGWNFMGSM